ncbi:MAG: glycosyltransferase family 4 protein, partial [Nanoarchaeota archaeon]
PFVIFEGSHVPKYWLKHLLDERIKLIFVPSKHCKDAIMNTHFESIPVEDINGNKVKNMNKHSLLHKKIVVIPHGVDTELFCLNRLENNDRFTFVANKGWSKGNEDRGGIQHLLKAYHEEFTAEDKVDLNIKINTAYCHPGWNFDQELKNIGITRTENSPSLRVSLDTVDYKDMHKFYVGDVFVSVAEAEGFNLPVLEAMSCGRPAIVSSFGGQTDFVNENNGWLISGEMYEVKSDILYEGVQWCKPNIEELRKVMRYCYNNREECKLKGLEAQKTAEEYTWQSTAKKVIEEIEKIK